MAERREPRPVGPRARQQRDGIEGLVARGVGRAQRRERGRVQEVLRCDLVAQWAYFFRIEAVLM
jgi:hypothetical protein